LIEPLGLEENPRSFVSRSHQTWRNVTGNDPEQNLMDKSILRGKILMGLPLPVRSRLAEVVGLANMKKIVYTDHIAHQVELYRKKGDNLKERDRETLRKLNEIQLMSDKAEKKQALMQNQAPSNQPAPQLEPNQAEFQSFEPYPVVPVAFYQQPVFDYEQYWTGIELEGQYYTQ